MNDKQNAQSTPAIPDSNDKTPTPDCCTAPPGNGDPGPGGPITG
jgi:hypothetical protein